MRIVFQAHDFAVMGHQNWSEGTRRAFDALKASMLEHVMKCLRLDQDVPDKLFKQHNEEFPEWSRRRPVRWVMASFVTETDEQITISVWFFGGAEDFPFDEPGPVALLHPEWCCEEIYCVRWFGNAIFVEPARKKKAASDEIIRFFISHFDQQRSDAIALKQRLWESGYRVWGFGDGSEEIRGVVSELLKEARRNVFLKLSVVDDFRSELMSTILRAHAEEMFSTDTGVRELTHQSVDLSLILDNAATLSWDSCVSRRLGWRATHVAGWISHGAAVSTHHVETNGSTSCDPAEIAGKISGKFYNTKMPNVLVSSKDCLPLAGLPCRADLGLTLVAMAGHSDAREFGGLA